jgi:hypothetical protein
MNRVNRLACCIAGRPGRFAAKSHDATFLGYLTTANRPVDFRREFGAPKSKKSEKNAG